MSRAIALDDDELVVRAIALRNDDPQVLAANAHSDDQLAFAESVTIDSHEVLVAVAERLKVIANLKKEVVALFSPIKTTQNAAKAATMEQERTAIAPLEAADKALRGKAEAWNNEVKRLAREAQEREVEQARQAAEDKQIERAAQLDGVAKDTGSEFYKEQAEKVLDAPTVTPFVPVREAPKVAGLSFKKPTYDAEVHDLLALAAAVGRGEVDAQAIKANTTWLRSEAKQRSQSVKPGGELCPGVRLVEKSGGTAVRS